MLNMVGRLFLLLVSLMPGYAFAEDVGKGRLDSVTWESLSPGDDWSARALDTIFPPSGETVIGNMFATIGSYILLIACGWLAYSTFVQIHKVAESGKVISPSFSPTFVYRLILAAVILVPMPGQNGFSVGQRLTIKMAKMAVGMAKGLNEQVANDVGPKALPIAEPIIPGTRQVVMGIMESELCRALINQASNNSSLMAEPKISSGLNQSVRVNYSFAASLMSGTSTCGAIEINFPQKATESIDLSDIAAQQKEALANLISTVRPRMEAIAKNFWTTKDATSLRAMDDILISQNTNYSTALTSAASSFVSKLRDKYSDGPNAQGDKGFVAFKNLGWTGLGAYYLEIARLNADVLSATSILPSITSPNWQGLGIYLTKDLAPYIDAIEQYQADEEEKIHDGDSPSAPNGKWRLYHKKSEVISTPDSVIDIILSRIGLTNGVLTLLINTMLSPTSGNNWNDPLASLIKLGHILIHIGMAIIGGAALLSSKTAAGASTLANLAVGDLPGAMASAAAMGMSDVIKAILTPIFAAASMLILPGVMLAFILPMVPYAFWMAGVAGWFLIVVEAVIGMPLWGLAHLTFAGDGFHGKAIRGYQIIFSVMFRPIFMVAGLMLSYPVFSLMSWLIMKSFTVATGFVFDHGYLTDNWIGSGVLLAMFVVLEMTMAVLCFRLVATLPHHIPDLAGMGSIGRVNSDAFANDITGKGIAVPAQKTSKFAEDIASSVGGAASGEQIDPAVRAMLPPSDAPKT